ncbi:MAG: acyl-CoA/acyl-ACP dehydrogenase [Spirochaetaceae bacterium]|nr:acyl-CoA/acyl-ACP dehydrogenase [Myxococcales bacterium]MCB9723882.1 acyl-CoA/acyl-ACP dehydrogenase [Spirochaetaceae bacterium]
MDFSYSEEQQAIFDLAARILKEGSPADRLLALERADGPRFDRDLWAKLGEAGLLAIGVPEAYDGGGLGFLELAGVIEHVGRTTAAVPYLETTVLGGLPIAEFGSEAQKKAILPELAAGARIVTAALVEPEAEVEAPTATAVGDAGGWRLDGVKSFVPAAAIADQILVSAMTDRGPAVFLVDREAAGVSLEPLSTTSRTPESRLTLAGVKLGTEALLGRLGQGREIIEWIDLRANAALCSLMLGCCEAALEQTAEYSKTRKQFDQPIAMFQSVAHRQADAYIDTQTVRLSALEVAWRIAVGRDARAEVAIAKHLASEAGFHVTRAAQHIHGGIGVDREYQVHRYYVYARQIELMLGGSSHHLRRLGQLIADDAA